MPRWQYPPPHRTAQGHGKNRAHLEGSATGNVKPEAREHQKRRREDRKREGEGPMPPEPQTDARDEIGQPGHGIEPQHEGHHGPHIERPQKRRATRYQGQNAEGDGNATRNAGTCARASHVACPAARGQAPSAPRTGAGPLAPAIRSAPPVSSGSRHPAPMRSAGWRHPRG